MMSDEQDRVEIVGPGVEVAYAICGESQQGDFARLEIASSYPYVYICKRCVDNIAAMFPEKK